MTDCGRPASEPHSPGNAAVVALFAALLLVPAVLALTGHARFDTAFIEGTELRHPFVAPPPSRGALATGGWQRDAEREIADAFPLRRNLIETYDRAKYVWLHDVASSAVIRGRDGWLFFGNEERSYVTGRYDLTDAQLATAADIYAARSRWCARLGIRYVFLLAPDKSTIYARYLPAGMTLATPTIADRLVPMLRARGVTVVDIRATLTSKAQTGEAQAGAAQASAAKAGEAQPVGKNVNDAAADGELYSKGDTHWNDAGAYFAYRALVHALEGTSVRDRVPRQAITVRTSDEDGDLLKVAGVSGLVPNRVVRYDFPHQARAVPPPAYPGDPYAAELTAQATARDGAALPNAVVFGDSFAAALVPFLAEDFGRLVVLRYDSVSGVQFDRHAVETEKPAVAVQEIVERSLVFAPDFKP